MAANANITQRYLTQLDESCKVLLSEEESQYIRHAIKDYRNYKSVEKLVRSLGTCLNTTGKLQIVKAARNFILPNQVKEFDTCIKQAFNGNPKEGRQYLNGISKQGKYRIVTLTNNTDTGFTICGGKESGLGVYVARVLRDSPAWNGGLMKNDKIFEVNGISLQNIPLHSAASLLVSLNKLKLVVKEENQLQNLSELGSINPWSLNAAGEQSSIDNPVKICPLRDFAPAEPGFSSLQSSINQSQDSIRASSVATDMASSFLDFDEKEAEERIINLSIHVNKDGFIGFNIRGGYEYGLGIYVSSVDQGSIAEKCGITVGDHILEANGKSFGSILHKDAVAFFKSSKDVLLKVKAVGRIPSEKCFIEEYSWLAPDGSVITGHRKSEYLSSSMPSSLTRTCSSRRDFGTDTAELAMSETINLPIESLSALHTTEIGTDPIILEVEKENGSSKMMHSNELEMAPGGTQMEGDEAELRRFPSATSLISKKSSDSGKSERGTKSSANSGEYSDSDRSRGEGGGNLSLPKAKRSKSFLQKQGDKLKAKFTLKSKKKSVKQNIFDSELYQKSSQTKDWLDYIEEKAKNLLSFNHYTALMKQIKDYLEKGEIELFSSNVLELLDTPAKPLVMDIRAIVFPHDLGRFDARVSKREMDILISNGVDVAKSPILDGQLSEVPPKRTLVTAVQDKSGKFRLKSQTDAEKFEKEKEEQTKVLSKKYAKQRSILERETTIERYKSFSKVPRASKEHTEAWILELDEKNDSGLDYIPTKEGTTSIDELYAKVDKRNRGNLNGIFPLLNNSEILEEDNVKGKLVAERTMSDIVEDQGYAVPDLNNASLNDDKNVDTESDDCIDSIGKKSHAKSLIKVIVEKHGKTLGISISGGRGSTQQPEIRIERVYPVGAVAEAGILKAGYRLISIDGHSLENATHNEAVDLIRRSFTNKAKPVMEIVASQS